MRQATSVDAQLLQSWFTDVSQLYYWAGPGLSFGSSISDFCQQIKLEELSSFVLTDGEDVLGFGQFYIRLGRHHLGRLAIAPQFRGKGYSKYLVQLLCNKAEKVQDAQGFSLFVMPDNHTAINLYATLGFAESRYPEAIPGGLSNCLYMISQDLLKKAKKC